MNKDLLADNKRPLIYILPIITFLLTMIVYGRSVLLPFFFDDLVWLPYVTETSIEKIWSEPSIFPYYRPLAPTIWRLSYLLWDSHQSVWLHGMNLVLHAINGWLVGLLAMTVFSRGDTSVSNRYLLAFISATIYIIFPFHFQTIPWVTAAFHLFVTTFTLGSLLAYWQFRQTGRRYWVVIGMLLALAALFTQENGVLVAPMVLALEVVRGRQQWKWRTALLWFIPTLIWLPIWLTMPRATGEVALNSPETIGQNLVWFLQGAAFPLTWMGGWLRDNWTGNGFWTAVFLSIIALVSGGMLLWRTRTPIVSRLLFALMFSVLASLPALLLLPFAYLLSSPRLMTLTAVGIAWFWAAVITTGIAWSVRCVRNRRKTAVVGMMITAVFMILLFLPALSFLQRQMRTHLWLGSAFDQMIIFATEVNAQGRAAIAINFPYVVGVHQPTFGIGHEGVVFVVSYVPVPSIISTQTGIPANFDVVRYNDIRPQMPYLYGVMGDGQNFPDLLAQTSNPQIFNTEFSENGIVIQEVGLAAPIVDEMPPLARFPSEDIVLRHGWITAVNNQYRIDTIWEINNPPPYEITLFVHLLDKSGQLVAQADGHTWARTYPMGQWASGAIIQDTRYVTVDDESVTVQVGLYNGMNGERLTAETAVGQPIPNDAIIIDR